MLPVLDGGRMKKIMSTILITLLFSFKSANANYLVEEFSIPTIDDETRLTGQIDFPKNSQQSRHPLVVMVPGTGLFDRDADFGHTAYNGESGSNSKDLIFKEISKKLVRKGFAVLRYDYRGVTCSKQTMPLCENCDSKKEKMLHYLKTCINSDIRTKVTPENIRTDIKQVYDWGMQHAKIDHEKVIAFGHSEGSVNLSYLVKNSQIYPHSLVFMGGLAENLESTIKWQFTGRMVSEILSFDRDNDKVITNDELREGHKNSFMKAMPIEGLLSPSGSWVKSSLDKTFKKLYASQKKKALSKDDDAPYGSKFATQASYRWWKMFFTDSSNITDNLIGFTNPVIYHNGDIDSQVNFSRQQKFIEIALQAGRNITVVKHEGKGHALSKDAIFGPLSDDSMDALIQSFVDTLQK